MAFICICQDPAAEFILQNLTRDLLDLLYIFQQLNNILGNMAAFPKTIAYGNEMCYNDANCV